MAGFSPPFPCPSPPPALRLLRRPVPPCSGARQPRAGSGDRQPGSPATGAERGGAGRGGAGFPAGLSAAGSKTAARSIRGTARACRDLPGKPGGGAGGCCPRAGQPGPAPLPAPAPAVRRRALSPGEGEAAPGTEQGSPARSRPARSYPALAAVHSLLLEALAHGEADLGGAHRGGRLDVEAVAVLADLHVRLGGGGHGHLAQHGVHTWRAAAGVSQPGSPRPAPRARPPARPPLPSALRSSSKFSLLFIFQVPAKLGMAGLVRCGPWGRLSGWWRRGHLVSGADAAPPSERVPSPRCLFPAPAALPGGQAAAAVRAPRPPARPPSITAAPQLGSGVPEKPPCPGYCPHARGEGPWAAPPGLRAPRAQRPGSGGRPGA